LAGSSRSSSRTRICRIVAGCNAGVCVSLAIRLGYRTSRFYPPPAPGVSQSLAVGEEGRFASVAANDRHPGPPDPCRRGQACRHVTASPDLVDLGLRRGQPLLRV